MHDNSSPRQATMARIGLRGTASGVGALCSDALRSCVVMRIPSRESIRRQSCRRTCKCVLRAASGRCVHRRQPSADAQAALARCLRRWLQVVGEVARIGTEHAGAPRQHSASPVDRRARSPAVDAERETLASSAIAFGTIAEGSTTVRFAVETAARDRSRLRSRIRRVSGARSSSRPTSRSVESSDHRREPRA